MVSGSAGIKVNTQTGEMSYGFASNLRDALPNASFIGFTGTPIEKTDANTPAGAGKMSDDELTELETPHRFDTSSRPAT